MRTLRLILGSLCFIIFGGSLYGQYRLPVDFSGSDSTQITGNLNRFADHWGLHLGEIPGFVFPADGEFPRIQFYYQQSGGFTHQKSRYDGNPPDGITSLGTFTAMGDVTSNLQLILRYNTLALENRGAVLNGYGARFRSAVGTDSLHALAIGVLNQKVADAGNFSANSLDISFQYGWFLGYWTIRADLAASFVDGKVDVSGNSAIGTAHDGRYEHRTIHGGLALYRQYRRITTGLTLRTNLNIWTLHGTIGWSLPSNF
ncbi:MAG: hypothetical protein K9N46_10295 [Candidatus Marinimicrobia bacterium]|nr:hypothetical protein [Candidatus Neomarinimicrobiota bacterium]MCF7829232.1 hypothetical protein [Candidatus Neomarinimicrobiota bacterium]MCF7881115.1 hypothetical protein [Candidatus Neomarinimicrobiota bacterium]